MSIVDLKGFQSIFIRGTEGSAFGIRRLEIKPKIATPTTPAEINVLPAGWSIKRPPHRVPERIAIYVPALTSPLPATSSFSFRCWGSMLNFSGPKKADWAPIKKRSIIRPQRFKKVKAAAVSTISTISINLMILIRKDFSYLSASCPAVEEKRKKGSMKRPAMEVMSNCAFSPYSSASLNVISMTRAFLNKLSLNAPKNCVRKSGRNRLTVNSSNCVFILASP